MYEPHFWQPPNIWYPPAQSGGYPMMPPQYPYFAPYRMPPVYPYQKRKAMCFPPFKIGFGITSLVLGIISILLLEGSVFIDSFLIYFISIICCLLSIPFCVIDRIRNKRFHGVTLAGLILGIIAVCEWIFIAFIAVVLIFAFGVFGSSGGGEIADMAFHCFF